MEHILIINIHKKNECNLQNTWVLQCILRTILQIFRIYPQNITNDFTTFHLTNLTYLQDQANSKNTIHTLETTRIILTNNSWRKHATTYNCSNYRIYLYVLKKNKLNEFLFLQITQELFISIFQDINTPQLVNYEREVGFRCACRL